MEEIKVELSAPLLPGQYYVKVTTVGGAAATPEIFTVTVSLKLLFSSPTYDYTCTALARTSGGR